MLSLLLQNIRPLSFSPEPSTGLLWTGQYPLKNDRAGLADDFMSVLSPYSCLWSPRDESVLVADSLPLACIIYCQSTSTSTSLGPGKMTAFPEIVEEIQNLASVFHSRHVVFHPIRPLDPSKTMSFSSQEKGRNVSPSEELDGWVRSSNLMLKLGWSLSPSLAHLIGIHEYMQAIGMIHRELRLLDFWIHRKT